MKIFLLGSGPGRAWARTFLDNVSAALEAKPEIVDVDGMSPRDALAVLAVEPTDVLILVPATFFVDDGALPDASADVVRDEAQKAILAIELARRIPFTLCLRPAEVARWPQLIVKLLDANAADVLPLAELAPIEAVARDRRAVVSVPPSPSLLRTYLMPLVAAADHPASIVVAWPRNCFLYGDAPGEGLPATVELAGRGRILAYGPYMPLPSGRWRAIAYLGFSADIGSMPFILEADTNVGITRGFFEVKQGGIFTLELEFDVTDPFHPVEFRLVSQDSALEGLASLIEIKLEQSSTSG